MRACTLLSAASRLSTTIVRPLIPPRVVAPLREDVGGVEELLVQTRPADEAGVGERRDVDLGRGDARGRRARRRALLAHVGERAEVGRRRTRRSCHPTVDEVVAPPPSASRSDRRPRPRRPRTRARRSADASWRVPPGPTRCGRESGPPGPAAPRMQDSARRTGLKSGPDGAESLQQLRAGVPAWPTYRSQRSRSRASSSRTTWSSTATPRPARSRPTSTRPAGRGPRSSSRRPTATPDCAATRPRDGSGSTPRRSTTATASAPRSCSPPT